MSLYRSGWWPGLPPSAEKRAMCSDCIYHSAAPAGWQWDRCHHPSADFGGWVRNERPTCADVRLSSAQCGKGAAWFKPKGSATPGGFVIEGGDQDPREQPCPKRPDGARHNFIDPTGSVFWRDGAQVVAVTEVCQLCGCRIGVAVPR